jgi:hypothetical protein
VAPADTILVPMSRPVRHCPAPPQHDPAAPARSDAAAAAGDTAATDSDVGNDPVVTMPAAAHDVAASGISASPSPSPSPAPAPQLVPRRQQQPLPPYPMVTRSRTGTLRANQRYACTATTTAPPVPSSVREALWDPDWRAAMQVEFDALQANRTWSLLPRPPGVNVMGKWVFKNKFLPDGSLQRRKARCVVRGFQLRPYFLPHHQAGDHSHRSSSHRVTQLACTSVRREERVPP